MPEPQWKITLVMPSYQRGGKIGPSLGSVYAQTVVPDEVIVVNDGGFEETTSFVASQYPQARVLNVPHGGAALARNAGAQAATGDVLILFDDDDVMLPHAVETMLSLLRKFPQAGAAHTDHTYTNATTGDHNPNHHALVPQFARLGRVQPLEEVGPDRLYDRRLFKALLWGNLLQQPWAIHRSAFLAVGGFHPGLGASDDWDLYLRTSRAFPIAVSDAVCSNHFLEKDKPTHLTLMSGQAEVQIEVLNRVKRASRWYEFGTRYIIHHRLGLIHKWAGDTVSPRDLQAALRHYHLAIVNWPFDILLLARGLLLWPATMFFRRKRSQP